MATKAEASRSAEQAEPTAEIPVTSKATQGVAGQSGTAFLFWLENNLRPSFNDNLGRLANGDKSVINDLNEDIMHAHAFEMALSSENGITDNTKSDITKILNKMGDDYRKACKDAGVTVNNVDISHMDAVSTHIRKIFDHDKHSAEVFSNISLLGPEYNDVAGQQVQKDILSSLEKIGITNNGTYNSSNQVYRFFDRLEEIKSIMRRDSTQYGNATETSSIVPQAVLEMDENAPAGSSEAKPWAAASTSTQPLEDNTLPGAAKTTGKASVEDSQQLLLDILKDNASKRGISDLNDALQRITYTLTDIEKICPKIEINDNTGYFISAAINKIIKESDTVTLDFNGAKVDHVAHHLQKGHVILNGPAGDYVGWGMSGSAKLTINGSAGDSAGLVMSGSASLTINGSAGNRAGQGMFRSAKLTIKQNAGNAVGGYSSGGTIEIEGDIGSIADSCKAEVYHNEEKVSISPPPPSKQGTESTGGGSAEPK
ncbi:MAG: hypothetical protein M1569_01210 [Candidatus Marsarchaeota archaeon]|nr:hypothetical protein [Candidatus Marsarchaeota archaeon]MCL5413007.1 hypothetical protein [Candidatus Marsarchaeota archaeon]